MSDDCVMADCFLAQTSVLKTKEKKEKSLGKPCSPVGWKLCIKDALREGLLSVYCVTGVAPLWPIKAQQLSALQADFPSTCLVNYP